MFCQMRAINALAIVLMVAWCLHVANGHKIFMGVWDIHVGMVCKQHSSVGPFVLFQ